MLFLSFCLQTIGLDYFPQGFCYRMQPGISQSFDSKLSDEFGIMCKIVTSHIFINYEILPFFFKFATKTVMKAFKRTFGFTFSVLLLLSFSTILLPLDFFHNHSPIPVSKGSEQLNSSSTQKVNIQNKADYCWVCAVHIDKTFTKTSFYEKIRLSPMMSVFLNNEVTSYFVEQLLSTLRGPPSE